MVRRIGLFLVVIFIGRTAVALERPDNTAAGATTVFSTPAAIAVFMGPGPRFASLGNRRHRFNMAAGATTVFSTPAAIAVSNLFRTSVRESGTASPERLQQLFELAARKGKIELELRYVERKIAELEQEQFAGFERVATPLSSDYWESISDTVLVAKATGDIRAGELLLYHAPGIYRVKDVRPKLTTEGECWYFLPDRAIRKGEEFTIIPEYSRGGSGDGGGEEANRGRDPMLPYKTEIRIPGRPRKESSTGK
jgi:hypothetical protein